MHDSRPVSYPRMSHAIPPIRCRTAFPYCWNCNVCGRCCKFIQSNCRRNCSEDVCLHARGPDTWRVGPTLGAWVRWYARGTDTSRVDPLIRAWAAPPRRISRGWRACYGLTRMFSGSRASGTPGQVSLGPSRRPPCLRHAIVSVCYRGGLYCGRHSVLNRDLTGSKWRKSRFTGTYA